MPERSSNLIERLLDRVLKTSPVLHAKQDDTTLGKSSQHALPSQRSSILKPSGLCPPFQSAPPMLWPLHVTHGAKHAIRTNAMMEEDDASAFVAPAVVSRRAAMLGAASVAAVPFLQNAKALPSKELLKDPKAMEALDAEERQEVFESMEISKAIEEKRSPPVFVESTPRSLALAKHLKSVGAVMYGAYWCGHCYGQKNTLGKEAMTLVKYVECSKESKINNSKLCKDKKLEGYPTWEIKGQFYSGEKSLADLEQLSNAPNKGFDIENSKGI